MFDSIDISSAMKNTLSLAASSGRLSHAVILEGTSEGVRLAVATELARAILCCENNKPCGSCSSCLKVSKGIHPDLHILKKEDGDKMIKVDAVRRLRAKATVIPNDGEKSVFLIEEAQEMNIQAQNALLKIFEEPSEHVCFILTCPSKASLLETIISRATSYYLGEEIISSDYKNPEKAQMLACRLLECLVRSNELEFIKETAVFQKDKSLFLATLQCIPPILRDALVGTNSGNDMLTDKTETAELIKNALTRKKIIALFEAVTALKQDVESSANHNLSITRLSSLFYSIK